MNATETRAVAVVATLAERGGSASTEDVGADLTPDQRARAVALARRAGLVRSGEARGSIVLTSAGHAAARTLRAPKL